MRPSLGFRIRAIKPKRALLVPRIGPQDNVKADGTFSPEVNYSFGRTLLPRDGIVRGEASLFMYAVPAWTVRQQGIGSSKFRGS
jgi:hypothetical protein